MFSKNGEGARIFFKDVLFTLKCCHSLRKSRVWGNVGEVRREAGEARPGQVQVAPPSPWRAFVRAALGRSHLLASCFRQFSSKRSACLLSVVQTSGGQLAPAALPKLGLQKNGTGQCCFFSLNHKCLFDFGSRL